jgi:glycosyltransferase involved in cell wall biosynthesis
MRLAVVTSHPVQYQAPLFRALAQHCDLHVVFAHRATKADQAAAGFNVAFDWDVDLTGGFACTFMENVSRQPGLGAFGGCDTPQVGAALTYHAPDVVLLMGWHLKSYWQAIWACRRARFPVMVRGDSHLDTPRGLIKRMGKAVIYPWALRVFDAALYVGERSRRYWTHYGYPADQMYFSPHCVDNDWFAARSTAEARHILRQEHNISDAETVALFAGRLVPFKRPLDLISAAARLGAQGASITVMIAGAGALAGDIVEVGRQHGVKVVMLGFRNQSQMPAAYAAAEMLILPSDSRETWGLVANEALACGKPVIVSDACGCAADLSADGTAGTVFRCGSVADLAEAIRRIVSQPMLRGAISAKARRYSLEAATDGILVAARALQHPAHCDTGHG